MLCNFDLKSYLWFQIKLALCAHSILKSRIGFRPNCIPLSSITIINQRETQGSIIDSIGWEKKVWYTPNKTDLITAHLPTERCNKTLYVWGAGLVQWWKHSIPGLEVICGLSLLLVLYSAPRGFSPGTPVFPSPQKPTFPNSNSIRTQDLPEWSFLGRYHCFTK